MTIFEVKELISQITGNPPYKYRLQYNTGVIHHESKTLGEYEVVENSIILVAETNSKKVDIGVFDSHHLGSSGR